MKIRYIIAAIIVAASAILISEKATRVECYSIGNDKVECINYKTNEKWTEKSVNH